MASRTRGRNIGAWIAGISTPALRYPSVVSCVTFSASIITYESPQCIGVALRKISRSSFPASRLQAQIWTLSFSFFLPPPCKLPLVCWNLPAWMLFVCPLRWVCIYPQQRASLYRLKSTESITWGRKVGTLEKSTVSQGMKFYWLLSLTVPDNKRYCKHHRKLSY